MKLKQKWVKNLSAQRGISLVELMVSVVIGLVVIAGALQVVFSSKREFLDQNELQFIQTNSRYALELLRNDLLMAGYMGCATGSAIDVANTLNNDANGFASLNGLMGYDGDAVAGVAAYPAAYSGDALNGTDTLLVRYANPRESLEVQSHNPYIAQLTMWDEPDFAAGSTMVITESNCRAVSLFQVSAVNGNRIDHKVDASADTHNCTNVLRGDINCGMTNCTVDSPDSCGTYSNLSQGFNAGSQVMPLVSHAYYVGPSTVMPGLNALKREVLNSNGEPTTAPEEIALGVDDFEVSYGVDSDFDGSVDQYLDAEAVALLDIDGDGLADPEEVWEQVRSVKLSLVLRSQSPVFGADQTKTLAGTDYTDRFFRSQVNSTIMIRNRG